MAELMANAWQTHRFANGKRMAELMANAWQTHRFANGKGRFLLMAEQGFCQWQTDAPSQPPSKIPSQEVTEVSEGLSGRGAAGR